MQMKAKVLSSVLLTLILSATLAVGQNLRIETYPYLKGGFFTNPVVPMVKDEITITIKAIGEGINTDTVDARVIISSKDSVLEDKTIKLSKGEDGLFTGMLSISGKQNGIFNVKAILDPENKIKETNEEDNEYNLTLPVVKRKLHFVWYREMPELRWVTCITSTSKEDTQRLRERGVIPLRWEYGGMSWPYHDKRFEEDPQQAEKELYELFYKKYTTPSEDFLGFGIDETGGYSGSLKEKKSIISMKALAAAKKKTPNRIYAVWHGGGIREALAGQYRPGCDFLLLETYVWRAIPMDLKADDIYVYLRNRINTFIRDNDMIVPAYGNYCYTLIGLDTSERPDWIDLGEQEQVIRYIRKICPEMRGIAFYNGGYGSYGLKRSEQTDKIHHDVLINANRLSFKYFIKPCITFIEKSLWIRELNDGNVEITAAVSNIGGVDSGSVKVGLYLDGKQIAVKDIDKVPAGESRLEDRVLVKHTIEDINSGPHVFEARILSAEDSTVLEGFITEKRVINK